MKPIRLNIGCGDKKIDGFVNVDIDSSADVQVDVRKGIPYPDNSVEGIYSEHFIEHLTQVEAIRFLRECRRVLIPNGVMRIATLDLDYLIMKYEGDWKNQAWIEEFEYSWINNRCEQLNIAMREWGHSWVFNEEELSRLGTLAGLTYDRRCEIGKSEEKFLNNLEWRKDSKLIMEFKKDWNKNNFSNPLVSILIPAYNHEFFKSSLESAINQTYQNIEIIVCDDSQDEYISTIVDQYKNSPINIQFHRNSKQLNSFGNYNKCFSLATGDYIKFLNDDDLLHPKCIARMIECFKSYPQVTLVTSHRKLINNSGNAIPEQAFNRRPVAQDSIIDGISAAEFMLKRCFNFIGEPTTAMFRRNDLIDTKPNIMCFNGRQYVYNVDVVMWVNLLSKGDLLYLHDSMSFFRLHEKQEQRQPGGKEKGLMAWNNLRQDGQRLGLFELNEQSQLKVHPLNRRNTTIEFDNLSMPKKHKEILPALDELNSKFIQRVNSILPQQPPLNGKSKKIYQFMINGDKFLSSGDLKLATDCYRSVLDIDERNIEAIKKLGLIAFKANMYDSALFFFERASEIFPSDLMINNCILACRRNLSQTDI
jgi:predicted SAM-dependent methyltransferase/glycosyltransferase involved in cell wall biosynthesis